MQGIEELPEDLMISVLAASPRPVMRYLSILPPSKHVAAVHAAYPSIKSRFQMNIPGRAASSHNAEKLWALLPLVGRIHELSVEDSFMDVLGVTRLAPYLVQLTELKHLSIARAGVSLENSRALTAALKSILSELTGLHSLDISQNCIPSGEFPALVPCLVQMRYLKVLDIGGLHLRSDGVKMLSPSLNKLSTLQTLVLAGTSIDSDGVRALAPELCTLQSLTHLDVSRNKIDRLGMEILTEQLVKVSSLHHLDLGRNMTGSLGSTEMMSHLGNITSLQALCLQQHWHTPTPNSLIERILLESAHSNSVLLVNELQRVSRLRMLDMKGFCMGADGALALASQLSKLQNLQILNLQLNRLKAEGMGYLGPQFQYLEHLQELYLDSNSLQGEGFRELARHLLQSPFTSLRVLGVGRNDTAYWLDPSEVVHALSLPCYSLLQKLDMTVTQLSLHSFTALSSSLRGLTSLAVSLELEDRLLLEKNEEVLEEQISGLSRLDELSFSHTNINDSGIKALAPAICSLGGLQQLSLAYSSIGEQGAIALSACLTKLKSLNCLNMRGNTIRDVGAEAIASTCSTLTAIELLQLQNNEIGLHGLQALAAQAMSHPSMTQVKLGGQHLHRFKADMPHLFFSVIQLTD